MSDRWGIVEPTNEAPVTLKDTNMGLVYDGPLVVMVNGASASASEIVASALQDYKRAIVAGSTTYGKATGQAIHPVDVKDESKGFLKVTDMRIYHVDGTTHQVKGVVPDFVIPDFYSKMIDREDQQPFSLAPKTITKKTYYKKWPGYPEGVLKAAEADSQSEKFKEIPKIEKLITGAIPLESKAFVAYMRDFEKSYQGFLSGNNDREVIYDVSNSLYDTSVLQGDPYHAEMNKTVIGQIKASIYIQEVYQLLDNIITKKP